MEIGKMRIAALRDAMKLDADFPENGETDLRWDVPVAGGAEQRRLQAEVIEEDDHILLQITLDEYVKGTRASRTLDFEAQYVPESDQMLVFCDSEDNSPDDILAIISGALAEKEKAVSV